MSGKKFKRRRKLIKPGLQLRMSAVFCGLVALVLLLQYALLTAELHHTSNRMPNDGAILLQATNRITLQLIITSVLVFLPVTLLVGILSTFRIAGPIYRFERFLIAVRDGEKPEDFRLRGEDELHDLAALLNEATQPLRMRVIVEDEVVESDEARSDSELEEAA